MPRTPWGNPEASLKHDYHAVTEERSKRTILTFVFFRALTRSPHIPTDLFSPFESVANVPRPEIFFRQIILVGGGGQNPPPPKFHARLAASGAHLAGWVRSLVGVL